jgi:TonB family protein
MPKPRTIIVMAFSIAALLSACFLSTTRARAQQPSNSPSDEMARALDLYNQGKDKEAVEALRQVIKRNKDDISAWHYLGLALGRQGKPGDAHKAHEKAAKLGEKLLDRLLDSVPFEKLPIGVRPYKEQLGEAADSAAKCIESAAKSSNSKADEWHDLAELLTVYSHLPETGARGNPALEVHKPSEVTTKVRILSRAEPQYTEKARKNQVSGTVVLRAIFGFDGKVRGIRVISGLPNGLTERAVKVARQIKFAPATIDGKPTSQYIQIEYNFNLY